MQVALGWRRMTRFSVACDNWTIAADLAEWPRTAIRSLLSSRHPQVRPLWITDYRETASAGDARRMTHPYMPPPIETATDPISSATDMGQRWRALMGPLGFSERLLWIGFVGPDRRMVKALSQVPLGPRPRRPILASTMTALTEVLDGLNDGTTVALLLTRPGRGPISDADRRWATLLADAADELGVPIEAVFRANDESLVQVEPEREAMSDFSTKVRA
jgi:hypothetical protein